MKVAFWASDKPRERILSDAFLNGVQAHGDEAIALRLTGEGEVADCDIACMFGVKSRALFQAHWRAGIHTVYLDKGYCRQRRPGPVSAWEYYRVAVDGHHPTRHLANQKSSEDRLEVLNLELQPWRKRGGHIILAGSSAKYHAFYGLSHPTKYAAKVINELLAMTQREIVYRPKPSWQDAVPIDGARYSTNEESIQDVLKGAHVLVTHGSNAVFEAVLAGVPCIVLGDAVAKPISSVTLGKIEHPRLANEVERRQWLANLAYWQWTLTEMADGRAWDFIRPRIFA